MHTQTHRTEKGLSSFLKKVLERILKSSRVRFYTFLTRTVPMAPAKFAIIAMIPMIEAVSHDKLILAVVPKSKVIIALIPRQEMQQTQTFGIC